MKKIFLILFAIMGLSMNTNAQNWGEALNALGRAISNAQNRNSNNSYSNSNSSYSNTNSGYSYVKPVKMYKFKSNGSSNTVCKLYEDEDYYYIFYAGKYYTVRRNPNYNNGGETSNYRYMVELRSSHATMSGYWYFNI